jgi:ubiquinone/menaquinone biosynthesis C-methylase UbiE
MLGSPDDPEVALDTGSGGFEVSGHAYDRFMGRYSAPLAGLFVDEAAVIPGQSALDAGCGPGALTGGLADRLGAPAVSAFDPSTEFAAVCAERHPGVDVRTGRLESVPFEDGSFDVALSQLVLHFVEDPTAAGRELRRVLRAGARVGACVWDFEEEMEVLRLFWDAASAVLASTPTNARNLRFGLEGELSGWLSGSGFEEVTESTLVVDSTYSGFDEIWSGILGGVGPAGAFCVSLSDEARAEVRASMFERLGRPTGSVTLTATARVGLGRNPG